MNAIDVYPQGSSPGQADQIAVPPLFPKAGFDLVAIAASAGGLNAIAEVLFGLPGSFPAAILVIQHLDPHRPSMMVNILARQTSLKVVQADNGMLLQAGMVYVAPPNRHLIMDASQVLYLSDAAPVHFVRPSADVCFKSAAQALKNRLLAIILSGTGVDGASGVQAVKQKGGVVIVEDEATAQFVGMPHAAIRTGMADYILPLQSIAPTLLKLVISGEVNEQ